MEGRREAPSAREAGKVLGGEREGMPTERAMTSSGFTFWRGLCVPITCAIAPPVFILFIYFLALVCNCQEAGVSLSFVRSHRLILFSFIF